MRPGWVSAWLGAFGDGEPRVIAVRDSGELAAVLPMHSRRGRLYSPANWHSPVFGPIAADERARDVLLKELFRQPHPSVELNLLDGNGDGLAAIAQVARREGRLVVSRGGLRSPFIDLVGDFDAYEQTLSRNLRKNLRRRRRQLEAAGDVSFDVHDGREGLDERLEEAFRVEASGWKGLYGTAIASRDDTRRFYVDVARWAAARGWLRLSFLRLGGRPIACDYAIVHRGVWYTLKAGYDEAFSLFSPGSLLLREQLVHCFEGGLSRMELLAPDDSFKRSWTDRCGERGWLRAFRRGSSAGLVDWTRVAGREHLRPLARRVKRRARRLRGSR